MHDIPILAGCFISYLICSGGALWFARAKKHVEDRALRHGASGEKRVAQLLDKAGYTVLTDLIVQHGGGTHQIDHVVCGHDRLFVIETKTWHGEIEGRAGGQTWTLRRPRSRGAITVYNPLFQNQTHAEVISAMTGVPVTPLVVSAGFLTVPPELAARVLALPGLPAHLGSPGVPNWPHREGFS